MAPKSTSAGQPDHSAPSALRQTIINLLIRGGSIPIALAVNAVLSRTLSVEQFGLYGAVLGGFMIAAMPLVSMLSTILIRETGTIVREHLPARMCGVLAGTLCLAGCTSLLFGALVIGLGQLSVSGNRAAIQALLPILIPLYPVFLTTLVAGAALRGLGRVTLGVLPDQVLRQLGFVIAIGVSLLCCAPAASAAWAFTMQTVGTAMAGVVTLVLVWRVLRQKSLIAKPLIDWSPWRESAMPLLALGFFQIANTHIPMIVLGVMAPLEDAAYFRVADQLSRLTMLPLLAANLALGPVAARYRRGENAPALQRELHRVGGLVWALSLPLLAILCLAPGDILGLVFGGIYREAATLLLILAVSSAVSALVGPVGLVLNMLGHERETLRAMRIALLLTVALALALVPPFGALGAAVAASVAKITWNVLLFTRLRQLEGYSTLPMFARNPTLDQ